MHTIHRLLIAAMLAAATPAHAEKFPLDFASNLTLYAMYCGELSKKADEAMQDEYKNYGAPAITLRLIELDQSRKKMGNTKFCTFIQNKHLKYLD